MHEASMHEENSFITLTYDDEHLPQDQSLDLRDFQLFMKRMRKEYAPKKIRFYHCGEYGDLNQRPHFHSLLFGHDFNDKKTWSANGGQRLYTSETLSRLWPFGYSVIGDVTFESAAYVARYVMKKITGEKAEEHYNGRKPEYTTMSRRPGIGKTWFEKFRNDVYPLDRLVVRGNVTRPTRFYDALLGEDDPALLARLKIERDKNQNLVDYTLPNGKIIKVSDNCAERLAVKEFCKKEQIKRLVRSL